ncbi:hypothetical protein ABMA28_011469 [Loxostege sticticalis]|uniref:Integrase catalytic domain-containing protein n=1 Tax=Loxostege sticticalis TaxID=481309 RepID=A0ABD0S5A6_LOXSC
MYENIKYFRHWFEATHFTIFTDHKPLYYAFSERKNNCSPRQFRYLDYISQFSTDIQHISGKDNTVAGTLSRVDELTEPASLEDLAKSQQSDPELAHYVNEESSLRIQEMKIPGSRTELYCDVTRFSFIHIDLIGPLPPSREYRYCLTVVDRFTRWAEAIPIIDITAESVVNAFLLGWVARFGCPTDVVTDRGRQFESATFQQLSKTLGFKHRRTTAYNPQCNGLVERFHRQLKAAIMCHDDSSWSEALPFVLLGIRSSFKEDLQTSSAELVYGEPLSLPGEFFGHNVDKCTTD